LKETRKLSFPYQTYNCQDKEIKDKKFETFTLKVTSQLTKEKSVLVKEFQAPFECLEPYFTVTTKEKTIQKVKPIEKYRGISKTLKNVEEDRDIYYIYVDAGNAVIHQYHIDKKSTRKIYREAYKLNMKTCKYEVVTKKDLIQNLGGSDILKSEDTGWGFEDDTKIYVDLPSSDEILSFPWRKLRDSGYYSAKRKYKKEIPQILKTMMGKVNDMATLLRNETKHSKEIESFKSLYDYPGTPQDVSCGGKVAMESLLIPSLDGLQDPDIVFTIDIKPSTKNEIKMIKTYMKNGPYRPDAMIKALQMMQGEMK